MAPATDAVAMVSVTAQRLQTGALRIALRVPQQHPQQGQQAQRRRHGVVSASRRPMAPATDAVAMVSVTAQRLQTGALKIALPSPQDSRETMSRFSICAALAELVELSWLNFFSSCCYCCANRWLIMLCFV